MRIDRSGGLYPRLRVLRNRAVNRWKRLRDVHHTASVHPSSLISTDLFAEEYAFVGRDCELAPRVSIGRYSMLASHVSVVGDDHNWNVVGTPMQFTGRPPQSTTTIGADVWIGFGSTILRGVEIGRGSIVAAGAVVAHDIPPYEVWGGVPARKIKDRFVDDALRASHDEMLHGAILPPNFVDRRELYTQEQESAVGHRGHVRIFTTAHPLDDVRVNSKIAASFVDRGYDVSWVGPKTSFFALDAELDTRIDYHLTAPTRSRADRLLAPRRIARRTAALPAPDWYYCPDPDAAATAVKVARKSGARVVFDIHEVFHGALLNRWMFGRDLPWAREFVRRRIAATCRRSDLVIGVNRTVLEPYITAGTPQIEVRNCAPPSFAKPDVVEARSPERTVFMHGKGLRTNGTPVLLEALTHLGDAASRTQTVVFKFAGPGATGAVPALERQIAELGISDRVTVRAPVIHEHMPSVLASCDVGIIAYGRELGEGSLPNRLFEYMAAGLAILAPSYATEIRRIVETEGVGLTVDFENPREVSAAIIWFADHRDDARRMGERAREAFLERHNWDVEFNKLAEVVGGSAGRAAR